MTTETVPVNKHTENAILALIDYAFLNLGTLPLHVPIWDVDGYQQAVDLAKDAGLTVFMEAYIEDMSAYKPARVVKI